MSEERDDLIRLSEDSENLSDFLKQACARLDISLRQASLQAGLSHAAVWNLASGQTRRGNDDTISKLALFFKVPEVNLRTLAGFGPQLISPTHRLREAEEIYEILTDDEKDKWIEYGRLLIRARDISGCS
jgi:transcriptional regulator with XRE-family HTH domain